MSPQKTSAIPALLSDDFQIGTAVSIAAASAQRTTYHARAKKIPESLVTKTLEQKDFLSGVKLISVKSNQEIEKLKVMMSEFLRQKFSVLQEFGITTSFIESFPKDKEAEEKAVIADLMKVYKEAGMTGQAVSIQEELQSLRASQKIFSLIHMQAKENHFDERHSMLLASVGEILEKAKIDQKEFLLSSLWEICEWNQRVGKFRTPVLIPSKNLPELFTACPVWFVEGEDIEDETEIEDPEVHEFVKHVCDRVGSRNFTWFFQMYNRRIRTFNHFRGPDIMPPHVAKMIPELKKKFDWLVIATPYHDQVSREWADPAWHANIDPYLIGFKKEIPGHAVMIERWSGTGLLPLMVDMIADTMDHLKKHLDLLEKFTEDSKPYWYHSREDDDINTISLEANLKLFGEKILKAFEKRELFTFLRS